MLHSKSATEVKFGRRALRTVLLSGASIVAAGTLALPALAQNNSSSGGSDVETVVVTGIRASLQSAQTVKKNSDQVVDAITAVDIGALPDRNVADALQRVPGVTLQRTDANRDPVRYGGTGNDVFVRGLAWVQSLTNGRDTYSAMNGHTLSWADVSASLLGGVDVYKNPDAEMIEGGVGGVVNLKTRKPFDKDGEVIALDVDYTYGDLIKKGTVSENGLYSNRWDLGSLGEIGALISIDYQDQSNRTNGVATSHYDCVDKVTGSLINNSAGVPLYGSPQCNAAKAADGVVYIPNILGWRQIDWEQQRFAVDSTVQWRPNDAWLFTFEGFYSSAKPHDLEHTVPFNIPQDVNNHPGYTYDSNGVWTGGSLPNNCCFYPQTGGVDTRIGNHNEWTGDLSLHAEYNPASNWSFSADAQYISSEATNYSMTGFSDLGNPYDPVTPSAPAETLNMNLNGIPKISVSDPAGMADASNYYYAAAMDHLEWDSAKSWAYRVDGKYTFDDNSWLKSVDFGYRGEDKNSVGRQTGYNWSLLSHENWQWGGTPVFLTDTLGAHGAQKFSYGDFLGGSVPGAWFLSPQLLNKSTSYAYKYLAATETSGWGWTPYSVQDGCVAAGQVISQSAELHCLANYTMAAPGTDAIRGINSQTQDTNAGYIQVNYAHSDLFHTDMILDGNAGLRVVTTEDNIGAGKMFLPAFTVGSCDNVLSGDNCAGYNAAFQFSNGTAGGTFDLAAQDHSYTNVLPSFNARLQIIPGELQSRIAYSKSMVRPDFSYTVNQAQLSFNICGDPTCVGKVLGTSGTAGNPFLKPLRSDNYDWTLEYYFASAGSVTIDAFYKDLTDYWLTEPLSVPFTNNGVSETFNVSTYVNGNHGIVKGFEIAYQQYFDMLPDPLSGFGVQANYTKIWDYGGANISQNPFDTTQGGNTHAPLPLEGISKDSYNVALLYSKYDIDARLAYNWRSSFLLTSSAANVNQPIWSEAYGQLDGSVFYTIFDHYKIGLQATNILAPKTILDVGYTDFHPRYDWIETDRKISAVLRVTW